jgi:hypothetical protein
MSDSKIIRDKLATQLATKLGTYTALDSSTLPAIYVFNNIDNEPPREWKIEGIECLISRSPEHNPQACFQGVADRYLWSVFLVQHNRANTLSEAIETLFCHWQRISINYHRLQTEEDLEECKLYIPSQQYFKIVP